MLHITVGTSPSDGLSLENDLQTLKAALLYADKVKLCSLTTSMLLLVGGLGEIKPKQQVEFLESIVPILVDDPQTAMNILAGLQVYKQFGHKKHLSKQELLLRAQLQPKIAKAWSDLRLTIEDMLKAAGMDALLRVIQSDMLELHVFGAAGKTETNDMLKEYVEVLTKTISDGSTYPLFDAQAGSLIRSGIEAGEIKVSEAGIARGKHSGLAANLLERLPLFEEASVDEILDIRRELEVPLVRFRSAIIKFSDDIKTASWDEDFPFDAEQVFRRDVEAVILDLEEAVRSNSYLATLVRKFVDKPLVVPSGSALAMLMSQLSALPGVVSQALSIGATSAIVAYDAYKERQKQRQTVEQNQLYFYYKAGKLFSDRTYDYGV